MSSKKENKAVVHVHGMTCPHCEMTVENTLKKIENIVDVKAYHGRNLVEIDYDSEINIQEIKNKIEELGYKVME
jgi:copper chaperone CopZ